MNQYHHARRVGITAILCALVLRLFTSDLPVQALRWLREVHSSLTEEETGQDVRFSSSLGVFSPDFVESPPASAPEPTEPPIPAFSGEEAVEIYYAANKNPDLSALLAAPLEWELQGEAPTVLILHTHSTESYTRRDEPYEEVSAWRTLDENYNMLSIGDRVVRLLEQQGIRALQDRALHDYPSYNGSYTDARKAIRAYLEEYPTIQLILDLHRDASGGNGSQMRTEAAVDGQPSAQLMVVLGTNHDGYEENLSLGLKFHALLEARHPGLMRPLQLRAQRFNQDLCPGALLIEVGAAGNSHAEALTAAEALAGAITALAKGANTG